MTYKRFVLFVEEMEKCSKLALMIKILSIDDNLMVELLPRLFAVVSNLEELLIYFGVTSPFLTQHYFPNLRRLRFPVSKKRLINDLVADFVPRHKRLSELEVMLYQNDYNSTLYMPPLAKSASGWVNRLVTYHGPRGLLALLTPASEMRHLCSSQQLDEEALHELSRTVSRGLRTLIISDPMDRKATKTLPDTLLPSLFPNLRSVAWLSIHITNPGALDQTADAVGPLTHFVFAD